MKELSDEGARSTATVTAYSHLAAVRDERDQARQLTTVSACPTLRVSPSQPKRYRAPSANVGKPIRICAIMIQQSNRAGKRIGHRAGQQRCRISGDSRVELR